MTRQKRNQRDSNLLTLVRSSDSTGMSISSELDGLASVDYFVYAEGTFNPPLWLDYFVPAEGSTLLFGC